MDMKEMFVYKLTRGIPQSGTSLNKPSRTLCTRCALACKSGNDSRARRKTIPTGFD
jgi:hypothetical protein